MAEGDAELPLNFGSGAVSGSFFSANFAEFLCGLSGQKL
jgi:hypothetical protein